jgi:hypothetical protein
VATRELCTPSAAGSGRFVLRGGGCYLERVSMLGAGFSSERVEVAALDSGLAFGEWFPSVRFARIRAARKADNRFFEMSFVSLMESIPFEMEPGPGDKKCGQRPACTVIEPDR